MDKFIKPMIYIAAIQVAILAGISFYQVDHLQSENRKFSLMAAQNAIEVSNRFTMNLYNQMTVQRSQDRIDMEQWLDKRISLRIAQDHMTEQQHQ